MSGMPAPPNTAFARPLAAAHCAASEHASEPTVVMPSCLALMASEDMSWIAVRPSG